MTKYERIFAGLKLIAERGENANMRAEHDEIYAGTDLPDRMTEDDRNQMAEWAWLWLDDEECWLVMI